MKPQSFAARRPYLFAALMLLAVIAVYILAGAIASGLNLGNLALYGLANVVLAVLAAVLLSALGWWRAVGFRALRQRRDLLLFWLPAVPILVNLVLGFRSLSTTEVGTYLLLALLVGFVEEAFFRGLMLQPLATRGPWRAAVITALLFGLAHSLNVLAGSNPLYVALQITYAVAIGFAYAALVLRTGALWPLVLAHFLTDFAGYIAGGIGAATVTGLEIGIAAAYTVTFAAYGAYLLVGRQAR